jgi:hypothetical protein
MPIAEAVSGVVNDGHSAAEALTALMQRESKPELYGLE